MLCTLIILLILLDSLRSMSQTIVFRKKHSESGALTTNKKTNSYICRVELRMDLYQTYTGVPIILKVFLSVLVTVCIGKDSHNALPNDLQTSADVSHPANKCGVSG